MPKRCTSASGTTVANPVYGLFRGPGGGAGRGPGHRPGRRRVDPADSPPAGGPAAPIRMPRAAAPAATHRLGRPSTRRVVRQRALTGDNELTRHGRATWTCSGFGDPLSD